MDFKVTGWFERNYKLLTILFVIIVSIGVVCYYFSFRNQSDTFVSSLAYAFFLFIASIYMSYMSNEIDNKLQERVEIYLNLQRVQDLFIEISRKDGSNYDATNRSIITFRAFTNRIQGMNEDGIPPFINQRGIEFNSKKLEIEDTFLEQYSTLSKSLTEIIKNYIADKNIPLKVNIVAINNIFDFDPDLWCREHLSNYESDSKEVVNYLYSKIESLVDDYSRLEVLNVKIIELYTGFFELSKQNLKQIEKMYGRKLQYMISQKSVIQGNFDLLFRLLEEMENRISSQLEEHDEKIEGYVECLEEIRESIINMRFDVDEIKDTMSRIDE
jgi:hypothetical protein